MNLEELHYELPKCLIAAFPSRRREDSRLLVVKRGTGELIHAVFSDLGDFLNSGDLIVVNDTKVFPARLRGVKESGGTVEVLLLERFLDERSLWIALIDSAKKPRIGSRLIFGDMSADVIGDLGRGRFGVEFLHAGDFDVRLAAQGEPPLPSYVRRQRAVSASDTARYQTVYAAKPGAIAAPTAGFHFTAELLERLQAKGVQKAVLTLHVGPGTFQPIRTAQVENHRMEGEHYVLQRDAACKIEQTKRSGRRVVAVGSTSTRTLEWIAQQKGQVEADEGIARLFIRPGDPFRVVNALITNFHLPASTPLVLVAAFAGLDLVRAAYAEAIKMKYRFYSYGDAMLIL